MLLALPIPLSAQAWTRDWPQAGDQVRVSSSVPPNDRARMTYGRQANDTLFFTRSSGLSRSKVEAIALANITRLEMPDIPNHSSASRMRAAAVGGLIGMVAGASFMYASTGNTSCRETDTCSEFEGLARFFATIVGAAGGAGIGSATGWIVTRRSPERWRTVRSNP
jgi:hypothetical protein